MKHTIEYTTISYPDRWNRIVVSEYTRRACGLTGKYANNGIAFTAYNVKAVREVQA